MPKAWYYLVKSLLKVSLCVYMLLSLSSPLRFSRHSKLGTIPFWTIKTTTMATAPTATDVLATVRQPLTSHVHKRMQIAQTPLSLMRISSLAIRSSHAHLVKTHKRKQKSVQMRYHLVTLAHLFVEQVQDFPSAPSALHSLQLVLEQRLSLHQIMDHQQHIVNKNKPTGII